MLDDSRMGKRGDRPAQLFRNVRMQHGEGAHRHFVDQAAGPEERRRQPARGSARPRNRLRHQRGGIGPFTPALGQPPVMGVGPVDLDGVGIGQQFVGVEPQPALRRIVAIGAKAVAGAGAKAGDEQRMDALAFRLQLKPFDFAVALCVEDRDPQPPGRLRPCGEADAFAE